MTKDPKKTKIKAAPSALSEDERILWKQVADTIAPLQNLRQSHDRVRTSQPDDDQAVSGLRSAQRNQATSQPQTTATQRATTKNQAAPKQPPQTSNLGQTTVRKVRSGRIAIEAKLDLHGMRQSEAHAALRRFIATAHHRGLRWVLVITGKGSHARTMDRGSAVDSDSYDFGREPGVLRRNVPNWLQEQELRAVVIGFQSAAPQHGGEGALYINLRRSNRVKKYQN